METVTDGSAGRESECADDCCAGRTIPWPDALNPHLVAPAVPDNVRHFAALADAYTVCGLERSTVRWTDDPATPVDCPACTAPVAAEPEQRRMVSLEVLTDELRAAGNAVIAAQAAEFGEEPWALPSWATVAVVIRAAGTAELVEVFDTDATWRQLPGHDIPAVVLRDLLQVVVGLHGGGLAGIPAAELLMPTPDVLAALDGRPDAQLLTAPVHVLARDVEPGMFLAPVGGEALYAVTSPPVPCARADCKEGASCVVVLFEGGRQHQSGYARTRVRIPAGPVTA